MLPTKWPFPPLPALLPPVSVKNAVGNRWETTMESTPGARDPFDLGKNHLMHTEASWPQPFIEIDLRRLDGLLPTSRQNVISADLKPSRQFGLRTFGR